MPKFEKKIGDSSDTQNDAQGEDFELNFQNRDHGQDRQELTDYSHPTQFDQPIGIDDLPTRNSRFSRVRFQCFQLLCRSLFGKTFAGCA